MDAPEPTPQEKRRDRMVFYPVAIVGTVFCITILAWIAAASGSGEYRGPVNAWIRAHGGQLIAVETAGVIVVALAAMFIDRVRTLRKLQQQRRDHSPSLPAVPREPEDAGRAG